MKVSENLLYIYFYAMNTFFLILLEEKIPTFTYSTDSVINLTNPINIYGKDDFYILVFYVKQNSYVLSFAFIVRT